MTASKQAKELGLKSLNQVSELTEQSLQTLINWHKNKPKLFDIILNGCIPNNTKELKEELDVLKSFVQFYGEQNEKLLIENAKLKQKLKH